MFPRIISSTVLISLAILLADASSVSGSKHHVPRIRHHQLTNRLPRALIDEQPVTERKVRKRQTCVRAANVTRVDSSTKAASTSASTKSTTISTSTKATSTKSTTKPTAVQVNTNLSSGGNGRPANWPSATQRGAAPAATRTSAADPFLMELSKSYNNAGNALYNKVHNGVMTYYGQGLGACGDTYDDSSFTAAVSKLMYDAWPGATGGEMNRNPICGPFVSGRKTLSQAGNFVTAVKSQSFVNIGGDGLLNCDQSSQCHVPLTATVKRGGKSIVVQIVDRCEGCAIDDIDLTPTAFAALADMALGRTDVEWSFNKY